MNDLQADAKLGGDYVSAYGIHVDKGGNSLFVERKSVEKSRSAA